MAAKETDPLKEAEQKIERLRDEIKLLTMERQTWMSAYHAVCKLADSTQKEVARLRRELKKAA